MEFTGISFSIFITVTTRNATESNRRRFYVRNLPTVTIQLPIFNEFYVAERVIESVGELDYPKELVTVQILDDSTDGTQEITKSAGDKLRDLGYRVHHYHRKDRTGFKAGALKAGLRAQRR